MAALLQPLWEVRAEQACGVKPAAPLWPPGSGEQNTKLSIPEDLFWTPAESPGSPTHGHTSFRSRPAAPGGWRDPVSAAPPATGHTDPAAPGGWRMRPCVHSLRLPPPQGTQTRDPGSPSCMYPYVCVLCVSVISVCLCVLCCLCVCCVLCVACVCVCV